MITRRLQQIGSSLIISVPKHFCEEHNLKKGDELSYTIKGNKICYQVNGHEDNTNEGR